MHFIPAITGLGLLTPLGNSVADSWEALCAGKAVGDVGRVRGVEGFSHEPRINTLARSAAKQAIADAGWTARHLADAALIIGTSKGPVDAWLDQRAGIPPAGGSGGSGESPADFGLSQTAFALARELHIGGPRATLSGACASGLLALIHAARLIAMGDVMRVLVVAAESSLHPMFQASFERLGVIAPPGHGCRPFDRKRAGFVLSEAAAAVTLEIWNVDSDRRVRPIVLIDTFAMGADASHLTHGDAHGTTLRAILRRAIDGRGVDLVHAHGTGTLANDPIELAALEHALPEDRLHPPALYSHKGALGHTLGAAGLVSIVINCMAHQQSTVPPNVKTSDPLETRLKFDREIAHQSISRSLAVAAGFGGAIAAVTLRNR